MPWHRPARAASKPANDQPRPWTDDRAWLLSLRQPPGCRARTDTLAAWVAAAGGQLADGTALLPPLRPHAERRLAEVELRRVLRDARVACVDDPTLVLPDPAAPPPSRADEEEGDDGRPADLPRLPARELPRLAHRRHPEGADAERARWLGAEPRPQRLRDTGWLRQRVQDPEARARAKAVLKLDGRSLDAIAAGGAGLASWRWKQLREALGP